MDIELLRRAPPQADEWFVHDVLRLSGWTGKKDLNDVSISNLV